MEKIGIIIGLDPASVGFLYAEKEKRLADSDADYVQVIHTDITKFGIAKPIGHGELLKVDFLLNEHILCLHNLLSLVSRFLSEWRYASTGM